MDVGGGLKLGGILSYLVDAEAYGYVKLDEGGVTNDKTVGFDRHTHNWECL